ncbi:hypothetical protein F383_11680 [Gossypium arboreum]|uniref:Uncharacterized protein n=1 Tax=Gossypium arboreum TaxID=29729 RepID=A0A0B0Q1F6_GOSAR|nr:hypothetical protein F383_11680 [Gossypium arboreum]
MPLSKIGSYTKSHTMPMSQTWSYTKSNIEILCYDICILTILMVRTGLFRHRHIIETFSNFLFST